MSYACTPILVGVVSPVSEIKLAYSPWVEREIWPFLKVALSSKPERPRPPKLA